MRTIARFVNLAACVLALSGAQAAFAQGYPSKPIRIVVPFAVGGAPDILARSVGAKLGERLGQAVVVENRLGASGNVAHASVANAAPDGYTLVLAANGLATNVSLYRDLKYDAVKNFAPITLVATGPLVLVAHPSVQATSVSELIALAKAKPGQLTYGSAGSGTVLHLAGEMFKIMANVDLLHVPYKAGTIATSDLLAGQIALVFSTIPAVLPQVGAGKLRPLGVTGAQRSPTMPDVPTIAEAGLPGYAIESWYGLLAPARTPESIIAKLNEGVVAILDDAEMKRRMAGLGLELTSNTPEQFAAFIKLEIARMGEVVRASGAKLD